MGKLNNLWSGDFRPLRVVAYLASPVSMMPHDGLPLDGILECAAFTLGWPPVLQYVDPATGRRYLPRLTHRDPANFVLPAKRIGHKENPDWYWCCSWAEFPNGFEQDRQHWNRRADFADPQLSEWLSFGDRRGSVNLASGRYKSYHMPLCLLVAPIVQWYCFGAADGLARLLRAVTHLGHKRSQGYGEVLRWEVWPAREDWSCWRADQPMRALPDRPGDYRRGWQGIRSPVWHPNRRRLCILPPARDARAVGLDKPARQSSP